MADQIELCRYHYDPLDRLASGTLLARAVMQQFYNGTQLATELLGSEQRSFLRTGDHLLAQQSQMGKGLSNALIATDQQSSVLNAVTPATHHPVAYSAYGHRPIANALPGLPGFNGEQPDPVTGNYLLGNGYRAFNPVLMRFNSPDSLSPFGKGGLNPYAYCVGDPVNSRDSTGRTPWPSKVGIGMPAIAPAAPRVPGSAGMGLRPGRAQRVEGNNSIVGGTATPWRLNRRAPKPIFSEMPPHVKDRIMDCMAVNNASTTAQVSRAANGRAMAVSELLFKQSGIADLPHQEWLMKLDQIYFGELPGIAPMYIKRQGITLEYLQENLIRAPRETGYWLNPFAPIIEYRRDAAEELVIIRQVAQIQAMNGAGT